MNYELERLLGEGAFGQVFLGRSNVTHEVVAVKKFYRGKESDGDYEASIIKQIPINIHLPRFVDEFMYLGSYYLVSNFIQGKEFFDYQNSLDFAGRRDPLLLPVVNALATQILDALQTIHSIGIVHRDLKPENMMFDSSTINFVLIDVGGACDVRGCGTPQGTPGFLSPDLAYAYENYEEVGEPLPANIELYKKGDVFALGVTLFEFVEGNVPPFAELPRRAQSNYIIQDFNRPNSLTYPDQKITRMITLMLSGKYNASDMIYQFTTTI
jgi:serine/threonine protein kinase